MSEGQKRIKAARASIVAHRDATQPAKVVAHLAALKAIWEGSPKYGIGALLEALRFCGDNGVPLPLWLSRALHAELKRHVSEQKLKHYWRWREVRKMRDARPLMIEGKPGRCLLPPAKEISRDRTLERVAEDLSKRSAEGLSKPSAEGSTKAIERSYGRVENDLPKSQRYKQTHTKRTR